MATPEAIQAAREAKPMEQRQVEALEKIGDQLQQVAINLRMIEAAINTSVRDVIGRSSYR